MLTAAELYVERLQHYVKASVHRVREGDCAAEAEAILRTLQANDYVIVLDELGKPMTTADWVMQARRWQNLGSANVAFVVGGANGLAASVKRRANAMWALSALTLPHRLALVLLTEQLYRVHSVLRGERYHRAGTAP